jgi:hypothetical protein
MYNIKLSRGPHVSSLVFFEFLFKKDKWGFRITETDVIAVMVYVTLVSRRSCVPEKVRVNQKGINKKP